MNPKKQAKTMIGFIFLDPLEGWGDGQIWPVIGGMPDFNLPPLTFRTFVNYNVRNEKSPDWNIWYRRQHVDGSIVAEESGAIWVSEYGRYGHASGSIMSHNKTQLRPDNGRPEKPAIPHRWFIYI